MISQLLPESRATEEVPPHALARDRDPTAIHSSQLLHAGSPAALSRARRLALKLREEAVLFGDLLIMPTPAVGVL